MKKITTFLGCVGVVCLFWGCSSDSNLLVPENTLSDKPALSSADNTPANISSSSVQAPASSDTGTVNPGETNPAPDPGTPTETEPVTVTKTVVIQQDPNLGDIPTPNYRQDEVFCWTDECRAKYAGMTSNPEIQSSSSISIDIGMSQEAQDPPVINGNTMTDSRDGNTYKLQTVAGKLWTAENMKYKTSTGTFCEDGSGNDVCAKYGGFYTYAAAHRVCPGGWRLPTPAEATAANKEAGHKWWTVGGRFKLTTSGEVDAYGLAGEQGYLWLESDGENNAWRVEDYSEKELEEATQASDRAFNVRCVQADPE